MDKRGKNIENAIGKIINQLRAKYGIASYHSSAIDGRLSLITPKPTQQQPQPPQELHISEAAQKAIDRAAMKEFQKFAADVFDKMK